MHKKWMILGLLILAGCAEKDPEEEAIRRELSQMALELNFEDKDLSQNSLEEVESFR
jgi:hypothetical protein